METNHTPIDTTFLGNILEMLTTELEAALDVVVRHDAEKRMMEVLDHCFKATVLAKTGRMMVERAGG